MSIIYPYKNNYVLELLPPLLENVRPALNLGVSSKNLTFYPLIKSNCIIPETGEANKGNFTTLVRINYEGQGR